MLMSDFIATAGISFSEVRLQDMNQQRHKSTIKTVQMLNEVRACIRSHVAQWMLSLAFMLSQLSECDKSILKLC